MPPGNNGPHNHPETPIRNTCHWLISFLFAYSKTGEKKFLDASEKSINYILKQKKKYNFKQREVKGKDKCNGLIGPAWVMEALIYASEVLKRKDLSDLALEIFNYHKFDYKRGLWIKREVDGEDLGIDKTFNHQLWFASISSMLKDENARKKVERFLEKAENNFEVDKDGLILHKVISTHKFLQKVKLSFKKRKLLNEEKDMYKARGYHQFNLYAFANLKENFPESNIWKSKKIKKAIDYSKTKKLKNDLEENEYGFDYNVAGIEMAYVEKVFNGDKEIQKYWFEEQLKRNFDFKEKQLSKNTHDSETLSARIYEATKIKDFEIDIKELEEYPFVSVIVPVFNDEEQIKECIEKILEQTYPKDKYEIIIVDNNSTDNTPDIVKEYPVKLLHEKEIQSSYAARNTGIKEAKGEVLVFTDSDCKPTKTWLENGVRDLFLNDVGLVAGNVPFIFKNKKDLYEIYDSIEHIRQKHSVEKYGTAATANLFTKKKVFKEIGNFPNDVKSGGDRIWTHKATQNGFKIVYSPLAKVLHPTRTKREVLKKKYRVGYGQVPNLLPRKSKTKFFLIILKDFLPPVDDFRRHLENKGFFEKFKTFFTVWRCSLCMNLGRLAFLKDRNVKK